VNNHGRFKSGPGTTICVNPQSRALTARRRWRRANTPNIDRAGARPLNSAWRQLQKLPSDPAAAPAGSACSSLRWPQRPCKKTKLAGSRHCLQADGTIDCVADHVVALWARGPSTPTATSSVMQSETRFRPRSNSVAYAPRAAKTGAKSLRSLGLGQGFAICRLPPPSATPKSRHYSIARLWITGPPTSPSVAACGEFRAIHPRAAMTRAAGRPLCHPRVAAQIRRTDTGDVGGCRTAVGLDPRDNLSRPPDRRSAPPGRSYTHVFYQEIPHRSFRFTHNCNNLPAACLLRCCHQYPPAVVPSRKYACSPQSLQPRVLTRCKARPRLNLETIAATRDRSSAGLLRQESPCISSLSWRTWCVPLRHICRISSRPIETAGLSPSTPAGPGCRRPPGLPRKAAPPATAAHLASMSFAIINQRKEIPRVAKGSPSGCFDGSRPPRTRFQRPFPTANRARASVRADQGGCCLEWSHWPALRRR